MTERKTYIMKAIILAAGKGTRLNKYTQDLPKGMLKFGNQTIIERQINMYRSCGIDDIVVIKGYKENKINYESVKYYMNSEYEDTNMVMTLLKAKKEFDDDVIVSYSDILFDRNMLYTMIHNKDDFAVAVDDNWMFYWMKRYGKIDYDTESLRINIEDNITSLGKESPDIEEINGRYVGILKFSKSGLKKIADIWEKDYPYYLDKPWKQSGKNIRKAYMTDLLQAIIEDGEHVRAVKFQNGWIEFDTNEDYEKACEWEADGTLEQIINLDD